jgi:L-ascorbate metabolism protein UlaG (beta-lactamase superfamily)
MGDLGPVDVGLVPIWGWGPGLGAGHLDPAQAAEAVALLRPGLVVPIHWGTYFPIHLGLRGAPDFVGLPPAEFVAAVERIAPDVLVRVLRPGQSLDLSGQP